MFRKVLRHVTLLGISPFLHKSISGRRVIRTHYIYAFFDKDLFRIAHTVFKHIVFHSNAVGQMYLYGSSCNIFKAVVLNADIFVNRGNILIFASAHINVNHTACAIPPFCTVKNVIFYCYVAQRPCLLPMVKGCGAIDGFFGNIIECTLLKCQAVCSLQA